MRRWLLLVFSLWVVWALRAISILTLPAFVDESLHILRAQIVYQMTDATASFLPGKLLTYYYLGLFQPADHNGLWLSREAIALLAPLSATLCFVLVKHLTRSYWAGLLVIWLYAFSPFLAFFERMALTDPFAAVFALALTWSSLHLARRPTPRRAAVTGALLGLAILAKLTALPLAAVPVLALILRPSLSRSRPAPTRANTRGATRMLSNFLMLVRQNLPVKNLIICYAVCGLILLPTLSYVVYQEAAQVENKQEVVTTTLFVPEGRSRLAQISYNVEIYAGALGRLVNILLLVIVIGTTLLLVSQPRQGLYLLSIIALAWGFVLLTSAFPSTRYLALVFPLWLVIAVVGLWQVVDPRQKMPYEIALAARGISAGMLLIALLIGASMIRQMIDNPRQLRLGEQDRWEYFTNSSAGYGLRAAVPAILGLPHEDHVRLTAFVGNCHSLRLYLPENHPVDLNCPYFKFNESMIPAIIERLNQEVTAAGEGYILAEDMGIMPFAEMPLRPELIATFERPEPEGVRVWLYRVTPAAEGSDAWFK